MKIIALSSTLNMNVICPFESVTPSSISTNSSSFIFPAFTGVFLAGLPFGKVTSSCRNEKKIIKKQRHEPTPADNVETTSMKRHDIASTLIQRCINVLCPLGQVRNNEQQRKSLILPISTSTEDSDQLVHLRRLKRTPCGHTGLKQRRFNIGIKHGFSCINIHQIPWDVLKIEAESHGFQHLPRDLENVNALKKYVRSLLWHTN